MIVREDVALFINDQAGTGAGRRGILKRAEGTPRGKIETTEGLTAATTAGIVICLGGAASVVLSERTRSGSKQTVVTQTVTSTTVLAHF